MNPVRKRPPLRRYASTAVLLASVMVAAPATGQQEPAVPPPADPVPEEELSRSPRDAFLRSLVLPGWGQAWVGAPVRGGVYFAMEAGALWMTYKSRQKLAEARLEEQWLRESGQLQPGQTYGLSRAREDQVEDWLTLAIFFLFFAGADAFVSAHLADFGEQVGVGPAPGGGTQMQARIHLGRRR